MYYNPLLDTDSYKASHYLQYPPDTKYLSAYIESRGGAYPATLFFGLQMYLKSMTPITEENIEEAKVFWAQHGLPFNEAGFRYILEEYDGFWPIRIEAVPEGTLVPTGNVLVQVTNTDPDVPWVVSYIESQLLRAVWYPTTVATTSFFLKKALYNFWKKSSDAPLDSLDFKLHDFGLCGVSSFESAGIGGCAHLVNFKGSDTVPGIQFANEFYGERMAGFSIPAAEHSTITSWGGPDKEIHAFRNMVNQFGGPGKIYACVSDSYDILAACEWKWPSLESLIISKGGTLVVRPDSGNPITMPADVIDTLMGRFGNKVNSKGYLVLPDHIRVIQGDGIGRASLPKILHELDLRKLSIDNIAFGMGGGLLQQCDRDTCSFAMKVTAIKRHVVGQWEPVSKQPKGVSSKASKAGRLALVKDTDGRLTTVPEDQAVGASNQLQLVWDDTLGLLSDQSFAEIRTRAQEALLNG